MNKSWRSIFYEQLYFDHLDQFDPSMGSSNTSSDNLAIQVNIHECAIEVRYLSITSIVKGMLLSKALTCMKFFLYKQKWLFHHGDGLLYEPFIHLTHITLRPNKQLLSTW